MKLLKKLFLKILETKGYHLRKLNEDFDKLPIELTKQDKKIIDYIVDKNLSMTTLPRLITTVKACKYILKNKIHGDFIECGVWRGGHAIIAKKIFEANGSDKEVYLYDTFSGMTQPEEKDISYITKKRALIDYKTHQRDLYNDWCYASLEDVKNNCIEAGLNMDGLHFIKGDVCETLDDKLNLPNKISIIRLDTDWYKSTIKELEVLYPILSKNGVLMVDDYGHWQGSKQAVDEYFDRMGFTPLLNLTDYSARICIKT